MIDKIDLSLVERENMTLIVEKQRSEHQWRNKREQNITVLFINESSGVFHCSLSFFIVSSIATSSRLSGINSILPEQWHVIDALLLILWILSQCVLMIVWTLPLCYHQLLSSLFSCCDVILSSGFTFVLRRCKLTNAYHEYRWGHNHEHYTSI